ncbi:YuzD family protein [Jeotgalibacillus proteolyticus]|uniref:Disulfide oxidoreductase n=1 Tax=Jeotgalibacillus proteolyticus TaxID=2082395 RepID=A0A2S5GAY9_9BACL|nr:YuzD family protein [Jeotgalibacillus proteolyticus]PPA70084.1 disulfide oxidoreductase [Jeotgalibacillus proteolyticus]
MTEKPVTVTVYGAETICPSCVGAPSSKETFEWLEAAIGRKFPDQPFTMDYVDINQPQSDEKKAAFVSRVFDEDLFYPVVLIGDDIIGEGNPRLKNVFNEFEKHGYKAKEEA